MNWTALSQSCKGKLVLRGDADIAAHCYSFNGSIKKDPLAILLPVDEADIVLALQFARNNHLAVSVLNGGHSTCATGIVNGGLVVNTRLLNNIQVHASAKRVTVGAGALVADIDAQTGIYGLALPLGDCPVVGIAGLTLGGGNGFLSRSAGLTCDHLLECRMILMDGSIITCSDKEHAELFRLLKGAGQGNFGIVTELTFSLIEIPAFVVGGNICWHLSEARNILRQYDALLRKAPRALNLYLRINQEMGPMVKVYGMYNGPAEEGKPWFDAIQSWAEPIFSNVGLYAYPDMQKINESTIVFNPRFLWKNGIIKGTLGDELIKQIVDAYNSCPTEYCRINIDTLSGAIQNLPADATGFVHRDADYILSIMGVWFDEADRTEAIAWARKTYEACSGFFNGAVYQNYADPSLPGAAAAYYGGQLGAVQSLREQFDPTQMLLGTLNAETTN